MMYGQMDGVYFQFTELGIRRFKSGQLSHLDLASRQVMKEIARLDGAVEWDELKTFGTVDSPTILSTSLKRLVDLGYIAPVSTQPTGAVSRG